MSDIVFLCLSNEGCFIFIIHHFVWFMSQINEYLLRGYEKGSQEGWTTVKLKTLII